VETRCSRCRWPHCRLIPRFRGVSPSQTPWPCCRWFRARRLAGARANRRCSVTRQRQQRASVEFSFSFFSWGGLWETVPGVVAVFCTLASRGRSPCAWQCRCSALCCSRWCCAAGAPAFGSTGVCGGCSARPGSPSPPHRRRPRAPATGATGSRNPPKKGKTQKESVQNRCSVAGSFARASMGRPPIQQARVAAGSGTGERRCPRPLHRNPG
jgi:hypothetical protein